MASVRFSKVVAKCGKPEVYLLMSETDLEFHKALGADKIMSLSGESHGSGTEYGTVGYDKKRLEIVQDGDHSLIVAKRTLKAEGKTQADIDARVLNCIEAFVRNPNHHAPRSA